MSPMRRMMLQQAHAARDQAAQRLTHAQFAYPHRPLRQVLLDPDAGHDAGVVDAALAWLKQDPHRAIGRLRRTELVQLACCLNRMARQKMAAAQPR